MSSEREVVWLTEVRTYGYLVRMYAYHSIVEYYRNGLVYELEILNDEFVFREDHAIEYESE